MPNPQILNNAGAWTAGATYGNAYASVDQEITPLVNNSGAVRTVGDVVITDGANNANTTTTVNDRNVIGVVAPHGQANTQSSTETYAAGAIMPVVTKGLARINVGANAPANGDVLTTSAVAGAAITNAGAPAANAVIGSLIGIVEANTKDAQNCVIANIGKF